MKKLIIYSLIFVFIAIFMYNFIIVPSLVQYGVNRGMGMHMGMHGNSYNYYNLSFISIIVLMVILVVIGFFIWNMLFNNGNKHVCTKCGTKIEDNRWSICPICGESLKKRG